jgi:hypothetical protein
MTVTGIQVGLFTTWRCEAIYLTGAQCFWSGGTPGRARCMPDKMQFVLGSLCWSSLVQQACHLDSIALQRTYGPGNRTQLTNHTTMAMHFVV